MSKWITFEPAGKSPSGKTDLWYVLPKDLSPGPDLSPGRRALKPIGLVRWHAPWRRYAFNPVANTVYEEDCLREIADFCEARTKEHRAARAAAGSARGKA